MAEEEEPENRGGRRFPGLKVTVASRARLGDEELAARESGANLTLDRRWQDLSRFLVDVRQEEETLIEDATSNKPDSMSGAQRGYQRTITKCVSGLLADVSMYNGATISGNEKRMRCLEKTNSWFQTGRRGLSKKMNASVGLTSCPDFLLFERDVTVQPGSLRMQQPRVLKPSLFPAKERFFPSSLSEEDDVLLKSVQARNGISVPGGNTLGGPYAGSGRFSKGKPGISFYKP